MGLKVLQHTQQCAHTWMGRRAKQARVNELYSSCLVQREQSETTPQKLLVEWIPQHYPSSLFTGSLIVSSCSKSVYSWVVSDSLLWLSSASANVPSNRETAECWLQHSLTPGFCLSCSLYLDCLWFPRTPLPPRSPIDAHCYDPASV